MGKAERKAEAKPGPDIVEKRKEWKPWGNGSITGSKPRGNGSIIELKLRGNGSIIKLESRGNGSIIGLKPYGNGTVCFEETIYVQKKSF